MRQTMFPTNPYMSPSEDSSVSDPVRWNCEVSPRSARDGSVIFSLINGVHLGSTHLRFSDPFSLNNFELLLVFVVVSLVIGVVFGIASQQCGVRKLSFASLIVLGITMTLVSYAGSLVVWPSVSVSLVLLVLATSALAVVFAALVRHRCPVEPIDS